MTRLGRSEFLICSLVLFAHGVLDSQIKTADVAVGRYASPMADDVVPGVVVVKLRRVFGSSENAPQLPTNNQFDAFRREGALSVSRPFPSEIGTSDSEAAAGKVDLSLIRFVSIDPSLDPRVVARNMSRIAEVEYAEPKYVYHISDIPNDSAYESSQHVYFDRMNVPAGWAIAKGSPSVVIATVDGGTNWQHPDLLPGIWVNAAEDLNHDGKFERFPPPGGDLNGSDDDGNGFVDDVVGWNFAENANDPRGSQPKNADHGTGTASAFGAVTNNSLGMAGTSWGCRIMAVCAANPEVDGEILWGFEGIRYAFRNGASIINCSWESGHPYSQYEQDIINAATQAGALIVAAAGNDGRNLDSQPIYPAAYEHVLSVGATFETSDLRAVLPGWSSNFGVNVTVFAPGNNIVAAANNGSYWLAHGTSFAAPLVAGLAGILKSMHPSWGPAQVAEQIRMSADAIDAANPGYSGLLGTGRVNFGRALSESPAGVIVVRDSIFSSSGQRFAVLGDTVILQVDVEDILGTAANSLSFTATSLDPSLIVIQGSAAVATLDSGQQVSLPRFKFLLDSPPSHATITVRLEWVSNGSQKDARAFSMPASSASGMWTMEKKLDSLAGLYSVKAVDKNVIWAAGGRDPSPWTPLVVRSTDGGRTWIEVTANLPGPGYLVCINSVDALHAWVGSGTDGRIYGTTDGGATWAEQANPGAQSGHMAGLWFFDAANGFALENQPPYNGHGLFVMLQTSDGGSTWTHLAHEPVGIYDEHIWINSFWWTDPQHGWFGTNKSRVWRTSDGGDSWTTASLDAIAPLGVTFRDTSMGLAACESGRYARTSDGGKSWTTVPGRFSSDLNAVCYAPRSGSAWMISTDSVMRTSDDGLSWTPEAITPTRGVPCHLSFADDTSGWLVTNWGEILRYHPIIGGVSTEMVLQHPGGFQLCQNYPNPFNPTTVVRYQLPGTTNVKLVVYDVIGREVAVLVSERQAAGTYQVTFDGSRLASGVYFYRLTAGSLVETKKLLLLR